MNPGCRRLSNPGGVPGALGGAGGADGPALTPRTPGHPVHLRPPPCPSGSSGSPWPHTNQKVPGIWMFLSLGDHYFACHMPCGWQGLGALVGCQACASEVGEPTSGHWSNRDLSAPCNIKQRKLSQRSPSQCKDPAPLNDQQATVLDTLCQTTSKIRKQPHPIAERLPKIIIRPQTPQNTPPDMDLPTRKTRSSLIHQNTGTSPLHQEAYTTHWTNLSH